MYRLKGKINGRGPVVETDLTATVEHLYRRGCLLLWLGWVDICCRGRSGHGLARRNQILHRRINYNYLTPAPRPVRLGIAPAGRKHGMDMELMEGMME